MTDHENVELLSDLFANDSLAETLGVQLTEWSSGSATATAVPGPEHANFNGSIHGGFLFSGADIVVSVASNSWGRVAVAVSIDIEYLKPVRVGDQLTFRADEAGRSRSLGTYRVDVRRADALVAIATATTFRTADWHFGADAWSPEWRSAN